ncbi:MAG: SurA N-terminal domain-containing protein [Planctomycetes bacterium]|nr:SurA N-terminal domain-containing protein [Planctomycetota bacterium]
MLSRRLKKFEKPILFGITILIALSFGVTYHLSDIASQNEQPFVGKLFGQNVESADFFDVRNRWKGFLAVIQPQSRMKDDQVDQVAWSVLMGLKVAKDAGVKVSSQEVREFIKKIVRPSRTSEFDYADYVRILGQAGLSPEEFERTVTEHLTIDKCQEFVTSSVAVSLKDVFREYVQRNEQARARFVAFRPKDFEAKVPTPAGEEIARNFDKNRDQYRLPKRLQVEYVLAGYEELKKQAAEPSPEEVQKYYDENKEKLFKLAAATPEPKAGTEPASPPAPGGNPPPVQPPAPSFRPFEEVRANIVDRIKDGRARVKAIEQMDELDRRVTKELNRIDGEPKVDLEALARELGLRYEVSPYLSVRNLDSLYQTLGFSYQLGRTLNALDEKAFTGVETTDKGRFKMRILRILEPEPARLTDSVRARVARELREEKARALAVAEAEKYEKALVAKRDAALAELKVKEMADKAESERVSREQSRKAFERAADEGHLPIHETALFRRNEAVPAIDGPAQDFTRCAFLLDIDGFGLAKEGDGARYLLQTVEKRPPSGDDFESKKDDLRANLLQREKAKFYQAWWKSVQEDAKLEDLRHAKSTKPGAGGAGPEHDNDHDQEPTGLPLDE